MIRIHIYWIWIPIQPHKPEVAIKDILNPCLWPDPDTGFCWILPRTQFYADQKSFSKILLFLLKHCTLQISSEAFKKDFGSPKACSSPERTSTSSNLKTSLTFLFLWSFVYLDPGIRILDPEAQMRVSLLLLLKSEKVCLQAYLELLQDALHRLHLAHHQVVAHLSTQTGFKHKQKMWIQLEESHLPVILRGTSSSSMTYCSMIKLN